MRIPQIVINSNTRKAYNASPESLALLHENERQLFAEDFNWDLTHCPSLLDLCVEAIKKAFEKDPKFNELLCPERNYLLEILDTKLPLELVIPLIDDELYWERRYKCCFGEVITTPLPLEWFWKRLFIERNMQEMLEQAEPQYNDESEMDDILKLSFPYVKRLIVTQLQMWKPPAYWDEEDIPEVHPIDHINFQPILKQLTNIEELEIIYGINQVGEKFHWNMMKVSINDCQRLGKAILLLKNLTILKLHRSNIEDGHMRALIQSLVKNQTLQVIDFSNCLIGDEGAICIAKLLTVHPNLKDLNLANNKIGARGCEGLGFALLEPECRLEKLDLKLNPLYEGGAMGIMRALVRGTGLVELSMAACLFDGDAVLRVGQMLSLNTSLKKLNVSNNWFDEDGGIALIDGMSVNETLEWLDIRETDINSVQLATIKKYLMRNRQEKSEDEMEDESSRDEEKTEEAEEQVIEVTTEEEEKKQD